MIFERIRNKIRKVMNKDIYMTALLVPPRSQPAMSGHRVEAVGGLGEQ